MNKDLLTLQKEVKKNRHDIGLAFNELAEIKETQRRLALITGTNTEQLRQTVIAVTKLLRAYHGKSKQDKKH